MSSDKDGMVSRTQTVELAEGVIMNDVYYKDILAAFPDAEFFIGLQQHDTYAIIARVKGELVAICQPIRV
jgi:hypothetical protein